jgi:hypothetical protein
MKTEEAKFEYSRWRTAKVRVRVEVGRQWHKGLGLMCLIQ